MEAMVAFLAAWIVYCLLCRALFPSRSAIRSCLIDIFVDAPANLLWKIATMVLCVVYVVVRVVVFIACMAGGIVGFVLYMIFGAGDLLLGRVTGRRMPR